MGQSSSDFRSLMDAIRTGSQDAAWELVGTYGPFVERAVRRMLSPQIRSKFETADFIQAMWASFFREREEYNHFDDAKHLVAYLMGVARHKVLQETRKRFYTEKSDVRREESLTFADRKREGQLRSRNGSPSEWAIARERWATIMQSRSGQHRRIIEMRVSGATFEEIGTTVGVNERTARRVIDVLIREFGE